MAGSKTFVIDLVWLAPIVPRRYVAHGYARNPPPSIHYSWASHWLVCYVSCCLTLVLSSFCHAVVIVGSFVLIKSLGSGLLCFISPKVGLFLDTGLLSASQCYQHGTFEPFVRATAKPFVSVVTRESSPIQATD